MSVKKDVGRGSWLFVVDVAAVNGKRQQIKRRGFKTKKEAEEAEAQIVTERARGTFVRQVKVTLGTFLTDEWLPAKRSSLRASTAASYERMIALYVQPNLGGTVLADVDGAMLNELYGHLLTAGRIETRRRRGSGLSAKTVRNVHGMLAKAFRDGVRWGRLVRNPCDAADPPKGQAPEMKAWTADEIRTFTSYASSHRWAAIWALIFTTGMRRGEVLGLRWSDVDLEAGAVTIRSTRIRYGTMIDTSTPKTARGKRTIALGPAVTSAMRAWRRQQTEDRLLMGEGWQNADDDLVVTLADGSAPNPESFSNLFGKLSRRAELRPIRFHDARHSYATAALASGVPVKVVSQRLGHADVGVTLKVYAHVMPGDDEMAASVADALVGETQVTLA